MPAKLYKNLIIIILSGLLNTFFISCKENNMAVKKIKGQQIEVNETSVADSSFTQIIAPYKSELQNKINKILCYNPQTLSREEAALESSLGNFYADVCFQKADSIFKNKTGQSIDFSLFNYGGIRTAIPKGHIKVKNIFELMPFENKLVITELTGAQTQKLFNYLEERQEAHPVSNVQLEMKADKLHKILINGQAFDPSKNYFVLTHDYLQHGGDHMDFFKDPVNLFSTEYKVRDALIDYLSTVDTLRFKLDGRFIKVIE
ncbi:MAG: 5'-nucleotidase C-terminal domain-containing protein [Flavobacteriaceae bacterium]|nr:5'-nucleotidase C-terminal domain-containing protein [Flavobacteriaceae bacterium]